MNPNRLAGASRLEEAVGASPMLAADSPGLNQVMSKFRNQYLPAAFRASTPEMNHRVCSALGAYLTSDEGAFVTGLELIIDGVGRLSRAL